MMDSMYAPPVFENHKNGGQHFIALLVLHLLTITITPLAGKLLRPAPQAKFTWAQPNISLQRTRATASPSLRVAWALAAEFGRWVASLSKSGDVWNQEVA